MRPAIPAVIVSQKHNGRQETSRTVTDHQPTSYGAAHLTESPVSPSTTARPARSEHQHDHHDQGVTFEEDGLEDVRYLDDELDEDEESDDGLEISLDVTWKYISRMYMLVPVITLLFLTALILLITFAWPPNETERQHGQTYPHALLWKPLLVGVFASCTVQTMRVPVWVVVSWFGMRPGTVNYLSTVLHVVLHEAARLSTLPLSSPSPTSGFHSSYYLGLGWGIAEAVWGIVQGYEQLALYEDVMRPNTETLDALHKVENGPDGWQSDDEADEEQYLEEADRADEAELERKVEILERMRARRDLEAVIGVRFPTIPLALHLLWRLDTLLINLGLTLVLSAFYFDPVPIYKHPIETVPPGTAKGPSHHPSHYLGLVWVLVTLVHLCLSLVWKVVGRVGVDAVTWGGLIVSLGSVFAGLLGWGGLV